MLRSPTRHARPRTTSLALTLRWAAPLVCALIGCSTTSSKKGDATGLESHELPAAHDSNAERAAGTPAAAGKSCLSTPECSEGQYCTVEEGACLKPPGCKPGDMCPAVCWGVCALKKASPAATVGVTCGSKTCLAGEICCNPSCGICTPPDGVCTEQSCTDGPKGTMPTSACRTNADCRTFSDYCTGCDCRALQRTEKDPSCTGPGVRCVADPCRDKQAVCESGRCVVNAK